MRRIAAITTIGGVLLALAAPASAAVPWGTASRLARHASPAAGWGGTTRGHDGHFGLPATAGPVSNTALTTAYTANGDVTATAYADGVLYIGGHFTQLDPPSGSPVAAPGLAALDARTGRPIAGFAPVIDDGGVFALAMSADHSKLFVGGGFTHSGGSYAGHIMAVDPRTGARDTGWHGSTTWPVRALTVTDTQVFAGGGPDYIVSGATSTYLASLDVSDGSATAGWTPPLIDNEPYHSSVNTSNRSLAAVSDGWITALAISTDRRMLYVGGYFNRVGGVTRPSLVALSTSTGSRITAFAPQGLHGGAAHSGTDVLVLIPTSKRLYVGIGGTSNLLLADDPWKGGANYFVDRTDGDIQALALIGRKLYIGGHFHDFVADSAGYHYNGTTVNGSVVGITFAARVDAASGLLDASWHPRMGDWQDQGAYFGTYALSTDGHYLFAGGAFDQVSGQPRDKVAIFPGP